MAVLIDVLGMYRTNKANGDYLGIAEKYKDPATKYAFKVLEEEIITCYMIKLDAFRHLQDLTRIGNDDFPYYYDLNECLNVVNFSKLVPDVSCGKPLPLMDWENAILCKMYGWRMYNGNKRFARANISVARTNGKTYLTNIMLTYSYLMETEGRFNEDLGFIAPVTAQARKGFGYLKTTFSYLQNIKAFNDKLEDKGIVPLNDEIKSRKTQNKIMRLSHDSGKLDAFHFLLCVSDEAGDADNVMKIRVNNGKITSGQVQTPNHQFIQISTAYPSTDSVFYKEEVMLREAMEHDDKRELDDFLMIVYEQDSLEETHQPETWYKSNPILYLPGKKESMLKSLISERDAKIADGSLPEFQNKNLNMWLQVAENSYLELEDIHKSQTKTPPVDIKGRECFVGIDLSHVEDDTAVVFNFPYKDEQGNEKYYIYAHSWVPTANSQNNIMLKEKRDGIQYRRMEELGFADITNDPYGYVESDFVYTWLMDFIEENQLQVKYICYDQWETSDLIARLEQKTDWPLFAVRQGTKTLNQPTLDFRKYMVKGQITMLEQDKILETALKNAILKVDNNGVMVDKNKLTAKIDTVDAIINTFTVASTYFSGLEVEKSKSIWGNASEREVNDWIKNNFSF